MYGKGGFEAEKVCQPKGTLMKFQCFTCKSLYEPEADFQFQIDHSSGFMDDVPHCIKCEELMRPNIVLKNDMNFVENGNSE